MNTNAKRMTFNVNVKFAMNMQKNKCTILLRIPYAYHKVLKGIPALLALKALKVKTEKTVK